jgi:enoyl-CoA hydratase/carnithine racemase
MSKFTMVIGIPKPENAFDPQTSDGMRRAILRARLDSSLIANVLSGAEYNGLSGEDTYVMLAYHALRMLEDQWQRQLDAMLKSPAPPVIIKKA